MSILRRIRDKSPREIVARAATLVARRAGADRLSFPLLPEDVSDSRALRLSSGRVASGPPHVGWLVVPPGAGSGGHTTLFRMIRAAADSGIRCTLLFYDRHHGDFQGNARTVREAWPWLDVDIRPVAERITGFDGVVASSWPTAHVLATRGQDPMARLYLVQDFEPYFSPRGAVYSLAEDSYRFGFRTIALGGMVERSLREEIGIDADRVEFGCDTDVYRAIPSGPRSGVVFYAKRGNDRRGFDLGVRALQLFHRQHPDEPIHVYGDRSDGLPFPAVQHGGLTPGELNALYNRVVAGIALSFTNISLVADELQAAGAVPVVNDSWMARADLPGTDALWALPTPTALADALSAAVRRPDRDAHAIAVAERASVRSWAPTTAAVTAIIRDELGIR